MEPQAVTAVVLAAGLSRRMGGVDKLLLPFRGKPLLTHTLELVATLPFAARLLVTTAGRLAAVALPQGVQAVCNDAPERGQSESLKRGVAAAPTAEAFLFFTADQPLLDASTVRWLLKQADGRHITYPVVDDAPAMPALFPGWLRGELLGLSGDTGGRAVRAAHPELLQPLPSPDPTPLRDIDTQGEYRALLALYGEIQPPRET